MRPRIEDRVMEIARRQHGVVTRAQLLAEGATARAIQGRLESGRMRSLHHGVYLVGPLCPPPAREMAAVLACGAGARASHRTAAGLWELARQPDSAAPVDVKVPCHKVVRRPGIRAHRTRGLESHPPDYVDGVPTTGPVQTLLDLAGVVTASELERMVARAERGRLITLDDLIAAVDERRGRPGTRALGALLGRAERPAFTRSDLEDRFRDAVRRFQLPEPRFNVRVHGYEVDCFWPDLGLVIELDGAAYHRSWRSQRSDRHRDAVLASRGIQVIRLTWDQLVRDVDPTMVRVAQALAVRRDPSDRAGPGGRSAGSPAWAARRVRGWPPGSG